MQGQEDVVAPDTKELMSSSHRILPTDHQKSRDTLAHPRHRDVEQPRQTPPEVKRNYKDTVDGNEL